MGLLDCESTVQTLCMTKSCKKAEGWIRMRKPMRVSEGKRWFFVELKSFEIWTKFVEGKLLGKIAERGRGLVVWIRFRAKSSAMLLETVESCCKSIERCRFRKSWFKGDHDSKSRYRSLARRVPMHIGLGFFVQYRVICKIR